MCNFINYNLKKLSPVWPIMLALYFLAISAFTGSAMAQGTDLRLNNPASANQGLPAGSVAYNSATKEYLVIWRDDRGGSWEVYGQRVNQANVLVGNNIKITGGRNGVSHAITYVGSTNQYLVVYERVVTFGVSDLWLQRVNADGTLPAQGFSQVVSAGNATSFPSIAYNDAADECFLIWTQNLFGSQLGDGQIYGQRLTKTGNPIGTPFLISTSTANTVDNHVAVVSAGDVSNSYLVCWEKDQNIWAQRVNGTNGTLMGGNFPITQTGSVVSTPRIAFNSKDNEFLLVWADTRNPFGYPEIYGQRLGGSSGTQGASFAISGFDNVNKPAIGVSSVAYNYQNNSYLTIWEEWGSQFYNIRAQHLSSNGSLLGNAFTINDTPIKEITLGGLDGTAVVYNGANNYFLTIWADSRFGNDYDIYSDLINGSAESVTLISPNGGEVWQAGTQHEIKWTSANFNAPVRLWISYSGYNPQFWVAVDLMQSTTNDGSYMWTVPNNPSTNCVIKVADAADGAPWDDSDAPFTITAQAQSLTVTSPNGGEKWQVGSNHNITWTSQSLSNPVKIEYSTNGGSSYKTVVSSTSNDGSHAWTIPNEPLINCLVKVSDATDGNPSDVSDAVFTISSPGNTGTGSNVEVDVGNGVKVKFDNVTSPGETTLNIQTGGPPPPSGFKIMPSGLPVYFDIKTTAGFTGNITICIPYVDAGMTPAEEAKLRLHVYENPPGKWKDITKLPVDVSANIICGTVNHLTVFAMMLGPSHFTFKSPTQDSYSIVIDNATLDGNQISNGDEIGVFTPAGLCVGASVWDGNTPLALTAWADDSQTNNVVDGYKSGEQMSFRIWDAGAGTQNDYPATPTYSTGNGNFGNGAFTRISLLDAVTAVTQIMALAQGWSWMSINVAPQNPAMESVMSGVANLVIVVNNAGQFYIPNAINSIGQINVLEGYKIFVSAPDQISVTGIPVTTTTPITLTAGWNFVSYLPSTAMSAETALASVVSQLAIIKNDDGKFFVPNLVNSLGNMTPGEGYKLFLNTDATLIYPQGSTLAKAHTNSLTTYSASAKHFAFKRRTGESFSVVVKSNGRGFKPGDEIGLFTPAGLCVGAGVWDGSGILGISAWADDDRTDKVDGFRTGERMQFKLWDTDENRAVKLNAVLTTGSDRFDEGAFAVVELASPALPTNFSLGQNYPNPFNAGTVISYQLPKSGKVTLKVYNLLGEQVRLLLNEAQDAGSYSINWDGKDQSGRFVPSGVYLYRIQMGSHTVARKAVFVK